MIGSRHPQRIEALHPLHPNDHILQRVVERMAQVKSAGNVRRRDDDRVRLFGGVDLRVEVAALVPHLRDALLSIQEIETARNVLGVEIVFGGHPNPTANVF